MPIILGYFRGILTTTTAREDYYEMLYTVLYDNIMVQEHMALSTMNQVLQWMYVVDAAFIGLSVSSQKCQPGTPFPLV